MFKANASRLASLIETNPEVANSGRVALTVCMLSGKLDDVISSRQATVLLLNAEKEILSQEDMIKCLEDLDDPA